MFRIAAIATVLLSAFVGVRVEDDFKTEEGFVSLFNGKDLTGWQYRGSKENLEGKTSTADERIKVEGGAIVMQPKDKSGKGGIKDLVTLESYPKNFHLRLEFRASLKSDSGVYVRGPQLQVRDYIRRGEHKHLKKFVNDGWNSLDIVVHNNLLLGTVDGKKIGDKDAFEMSLKDGKLTATLNGKPVHKAKNIAVRYANVAECTINGEPLEVLSTIPATGGIGLQAESGKFEFRRVRIKELQQ